MNKTFSMRLAAGAAILLGATGCGKAEREATITALTSAYTVRDTVSDLEADYARAFDASYVGGWAGVMKYRESAAGRAALAFLQPLGTPLAVDGGFRRAAEIREMSLVSAELVRLVSDPRGTWISYGQEVNAIRTRFDRALLALETGFPPELQAIAKANARANVARYEGQIANAVAEEAARERRAKEEAAQAEREASERQQADLLAHAQREAERERENARLREESRQRMLDEAVIRRGDTPTPAPPPAKLGGGTFRTAATPIPH